jgi:hypothetical protein
MGRQERLPLIAAQIHIKETVCPRYARKTESALIMKDLENLPTIIRLLF